MLKLIKEKEVHVAGILTVGKISLQVCWRQWHIKSMGIRNYGYSAHIAFQIDEFLPDFLLGT